MNGINGLIEIKLPSLVPGSDITFLGMMEQIDAIMAVIELEETEFKIEITRIRI